MVHRDLKPDNLFLTTAGVLKILDFGLARLQGGDGVLTQETTEPNATSPGAVLGTVSYMSPEQAKGLIVDSRSDLFSLGVALYEMLSGRHPFKRSSPAETVSAILRDEPDLEALEGKVPRAVERLTRRCLEKRPEDRFQAASDLAIAFELVERGEDAGHVSKTTATAGSATAEERPYPVLSSFTEADAAHFFGREDEVRALWEKIRRRALLAVIGPSGVGKTSFLRAGLLAGRPTGWAAAYCSPGSSPVASLARALSAPTPGGVPGHVEDAAMGGEPVQAVAEIPAARRDRPARVGGLGLAVTADGGARGRRRVRGALHAEPAGRAGALRGLARAARPRGRRPRARLPARRLPLPRPRRSCAGSCVSW
jgi:hypothetical protein